MSLPDLRLHVQRYLALRLALGFQPRPAEPMLLDFVAFAESRGSLDAVTAQLAMDWACAHPSCARRPVRLGVVRRFLVHLRAAAPETQVPAAGLLKGSRRSTPHMYSDDQIRMLLQQARSLGPSGSLRPHTYATLIGLLASSGLRSGEAVRLRVADVQLDAAPPRLHIAETKFRKTRLVALHPTTSVALRAYAAQRRRLGYDVCDAFFVSEKRAAVPASAARATFFELVRKAGMRPPTGRGPRLHDLRHSFATKRLLLWYREGVDVHARLPGLSVYLGHVRPVDTYWYLTATPELLAAAADRFEAFAGAGGAS